MAGNPYVIAGKKQGARLINLQKPWRRIRAAANLDDVRIHDLRHSFASNCAANRVDQRLIDSWLGHTTEIRKRYLHLIPSNERQALSGVFG